MSPSKPPEREHSKPGGRPPSAGPEEPVTCPHCGSTDVELESPAGSQLMTSQYWCRECRTVFERLKIEPDDTPTRWLELP